MIKWTTARAFYSLEQAERVAKRFASAARRTRDGELATEAEYRLEPYGRHDWLVIVNVVQRSVNRGERHISRLWISAMVEDTKDPVPDIEGAGWTRRC